MLRIAHLAGALVTCVGLLFAAAAAGAPPRYDEGGSTPVAREGSPLAARGGISKSRLRSTLRHELGRAGGASGAFVFDVDAKRAGTLFSSSGKARRILASNTKLFTTAAFLNRFGPQGRLETKVYARGKRTGGLKRTLRGSIVLVGDGDPALASPSFANSRGLPLTRLDPLARAVKDAGINRVRGSVRADPTIFDGARSVPQPGIPSGPYLSPLSGLSFNSGFERGRYAASPPKNAGQRLIRELRDAKVRIPSEVSVGGVPNKLLRREPLAVVRSPSATSLIRRTNTPSDNFFAEMLLKRLGGGPKLQATTRRGARRARAFARKSGSGVRMVNGSGLSRTNKASPREVARLLIRMRRDQSVKRPWYDSLAVAGKTGTLASRMRGTAAQGRCRGKTGTINGVSALSGYCEAGHGTVAYSILMNNVDVDRARQAQDAMVAAIARYR